MITSGFEQVMHFNLELALFEVLIGDQYFFEATQLPVN